MIAPHLLVEIEFVKTQKINLFVLQIVRRDCVEMESAKMAANHLPVVQRTAWLKIVVMGCASSQKIFAFVQKTALLLFALWMELVKFSKIPCVWIVLFLATTTIAAKKEKWHPIAETAMLRCSASVSQCSTM